MGARHPGCPSLGRSSGVPDAAGRLFCIDCNSYFVCEHLIRSRFNDGPWLCQACQAEIEAPTEKPLLWLIHGHQQESDES